MRIFFLTKSYYPSAGGVQAVTKYLAEGLVDKGHIVTVVTSNEGRYPKTDTINGVNVVRFKHANFLKRNFGDKKGFINYLLANADKDTVVISVCAQAFVSEWLFSVVDKLPAKKILYMHGMREERVDKAKLGSSKEFFKELFLSLHWNRYFKKHWKQILKFDGCVHLFKNDSSYNYFVKHGFKKNYVIENSCDEAFFSQKASEDITGKFGINKPYFIQVANYDFRKNQVFSIQAFSLIEKHEWDLVLIGSRKNKYSDKIERVARSLPPNVATKLHILYGVSREDTINLIKNSTACLLSSRVEFLPISLIEGLACGKPFISTHCGVVAELCGGQVVNCVEEMSYWMTYFCENPEYVNSLGEIGRRFVGDKNEIAG